MNYLFDILETDSLEIINNFNEDGIVNIFSIHLINEDENQ